MKGRESTGLSPRRAGLCPVCLVSKTQPQRSATVPEQRALPNRTLRLQNGIQVYLNGDGEGRGTHLSLYVVLMPGDFDALLPWPFRQTVSLSVLDQSGAANHRSLSFRPDPASKSFQRPAAESVNNVAVGFSCFIPLNEFAAYVKDDTLFVKVKVDMAGLEHL
uniref:MATH domain-containing protein n=1 Tax=Sander lucioperca TaxID=283035 RepID=A0A8D0CQM1_SANLU